MIVLRVRSLEFNRKLVVDTTEQAALRMFGRFGAFVMTTDRQSIKQAPRTRLVEIAGRRRRVKLTEEERIAPPGAPPYGHKGNTLKRFIRFAVDRETKSVVIGPVKLPNKIGDAPHALEVGGRSEAIRGAKRVLRGTTVRPHPHTQPAFERELPKVPGMLRDMIRK